LKTGLRRAVAVFKNCRPQLLVPYPLRISTTPGNTNDQLSPPPPTPTPTHVQRIHHGLQHLMHRRQLRIQVGHPLRHRLLKMLREDLGRIGAEYLLFYGVGGWVGVCACACVRVCVCVCVCVLRFEWSGLIGGEGEGEGGGDGGLGRGAGGKRLAPHSRIVYINPQPAASPAPMVDRLTVKFPPPPSP